jgi:NADH-quinone oxidoreductase subunit H
MIVLIMLIRWTIPRFRFDQLMSLAWQGMVPLSFFNLTLVMFARQFEWPLWVITVGSLTLLVCAAALNGMSIQRRLRSPSASSSSPALGPV